MTQSNILNLAKQGDPRAIAALFNHYLQPKGISVKADLLGDSLQILLEANQPLKQQPLVEFIRKALLKLNIASIQTVRVDAKQQGKFFPDWSEDLVIGPPETPLATHLTALGAEPASVAVTAPVPQGEPVLEPAAPGPAAASGEQGISPPPPQKPPSLPLFSASNRAIGIGALVLLTFSAVVGILFQVSQSTTQKTADSGRSPVASPLPAVTPVIPSPAPIESGSTPAARTSPVLTPPPTTPVAPAIAPAATPAPVPGKAAKVAEVESSPGKAPAPMGVALALSLKEASWLRVVVDGQNQFEGILPAGAKQTWKAKQNIELWTGNAGGVLASLNGGVAKPVGARGAVTRTVYPAASRRAAPAPARPQATRSPAQAVRVGITLKETSWLRVVVDGQNEFEGTLEPGAKQTWKAKQNIELWTGNAGGVLVQVNDGPVKPAGAPGAVTRAVFPAPSGP